MYNIIISMSLLVIRKQRFNKSAVPIYQLMTLQTPYILITLYTIKTYWGGHSERK